MSAWLLVVNLANGLWTLIKNVLGLVSKKDIEAQQKATGVSQSNEIGKQTGEVERATDAQTDRDTAYVKNQTVNYSDLVRNSASMRGRTNAVNDDIADANEHTDSDDQLRGK